MNAKFDADEIFEMAEQIERNGARYYRKAAGMATNAEIHTMFINFAAMEENHLRIFAEMRARYAQDRSTVQFDPDDEAARYLQAVASSHGWEGKASPIRELNGSEPIEQVLWVALAAEKDSVVFYSGMKDMVSHSDHIPLEEIIREELGHVALIQKAYDKQQNSKR